MEKSDRMLIQERAWDSFPAQELWYCNKTRGFLAFEKLDDETLSLTTGTVFGNDLKYSTQQVVRNDMEEYLEKFLESYREKGYECFGIAI
jgi:hypothetical protein